MLYIKKDVFNSIAMCFSEPFPEKGGIIGGKRGVITAFVPDINVYRTDRNIYVPNIDFINSVIQNWITDSISFMGIIHSHPKGQPSLSKDDINYICKIFKSIPEKIQYLYFPIALGKEEVIFYKAHAKKEKIKFCVEELYVIE